MRVEIYKSTVILERRDAPEIRYAIYGFRPIPPSATVFRSRRNIRRYRLAAHEPAIVLEAPEGSQVRFEPDVLSPGESVGYLVVPSDPSRTLDACSAYHVALRGKRGLRVVRDDRRGGDPEPIPHPLKESPACDKRPR